MSRQRPVPSAPPITEEMYNELYCAGSRYGRVPVYDAEPTNTMGRVEERGVDSLHSPLMQGVVDDQDVVIPVATRPTQYRTLDYSVGYGHRAVGWADRYFTPLAKQRAATSMATVDSLTTGWGYFVVSIVLSLMRTHQLRGLSVTDGMVSADSFLNVVNHLLRDLLVLSSVFVVHKLLHAHGSLARGEYLKENALHSPEIVDGDDIQAKKHDSWRIVHSRLSTALNLGSTAVLGYAAYRFAIGNPDHAKDNLNLLGGSMALEFLASVTHCWSEQRRTKSIDPGVPADIAIKGKGLVVSIGASLSFVAATVLANSNTGDHYNYNRTLVSALLCTIGAGLLSSVAQRAGEEMTAAAVASKFEEHLDPKVNTCKLPLGFCSMPMKESTRQRFEELLFKGMLFSTVFCTKRYNSLIPVVAGIVGVSVAGMLIGKSREVRGANTNIRIQQARQGIQPTRGIDETSRTLTCFSS